MSARKALGRNYRLRQARRRDRLIDPVSVGFGIKKSERIAGRHILVQFLVSGVVVEVAKATLGRIAKMITAVSTNFVRFL